MLVALAIDKTTIKVQFAIARIMLWTAAYKAENFPIKTAVKLKPKNSKNIAREIGVPVLIKSLMYFLESSNLSLNSDKCFRNQGCNW